MKLFKVICKSESERELVLRTFLNLGLPLTPSYDTVERLLRENPLGDWPAVGIAVENEEMFVTLWSGASYPRSLTFPLALQEITTAAMEKASPPKPALVFPNPAKYSLIYKTKDGVVKDYTISNPIEADANKLTAYSFSRGVRSFEKKRILKFEKIA